MSEFKFENVEVTDIVKGDMNSTFSPELNTPYKRLWLKLMQLLSEGWEIDYEEYKGEVPVTKMVREKDKYVKKIVSHREVIFCKGTAIGFD